MDDDDSHSQAFTEYDEDGDKIINPGTLTEEEKRHFDLARQAHRNNMTKVQKIGSKIFKGAAFIGKPDKIEFKDFDVGKSHTLILTLTNVSNAFNSFNILPLPQKIRNYFEVLYTPKGKISPGISNEIKFKFLPQINEDINSHFSILAETGQIDYPIVCTSKKAIVKCDDPSVNFGKVIQGEVGHSKIKIRNEGALKTQIVIKTEDGLQIEKANELTRKLVSQLRFQVKNSIDGYSQKIINFTFEPSEVGEFRAIIQLYFVNFLHSPPINIYFKGQCINVPVTIEKPVYDFEICLLNHIYREKLTIQNAGDISMSFKVNQPQNTKKYFQFNPVVGYIQKQSKIDIWVKFSANKDLPSFLSQYMVEQNIYMIPFEINIKEQVLPVTFHIKFKITSDSVIINPPQLNFGSIFQGLSSKIEVSFQNESELPQEILLYPLKKHLSVENEQTLFKILPKSTMKKYITYKSKPLEDYKKSNRDEGTIPCKIITGDIATNQIKINYSCQTIKPDLSIIHNHIDFQAIQIGQICYASTKLKNNLNKQLTYQLFSPHFQVCGLQITPVVETLRPYQEIQINIQYHSFFKKLGFNTLADLDKKNKPVQIQQKVQEEPVKDKKDDKKGKKLSKAEQQALQAEEKRKEEQEKLRKEKQEEERREMEKNFNGEQELAKLGGTLVEFGTAQHYKWVLPIYFKKKDYPDASAQVNFLQITTTSTQKVLQAEETQIDFGEIAVGARKTREFAIKNNDDAQILKKKQLPVFGCFSVLNSMREVNNNAVFKAIIEFQPTESQRFQERLTFYTDKNTISCLLKGVGVRPDININPENGLVHFGGVLLDEYAQKTFTIKNICNFEVQYTLVRMGGGVTNANSSQAISYIPSSGKIPPNSETTVRVVFKPDRVSEKFYEKIKIFVPEQEHERFIFVSGYCYPRQAFVKDYKQHKIPSNEEVSQNAQYAFDWLKMKEEDEYYGPKKKEIVLQFQKANERQENQKEQCFKRKLVIGSCKLLDPKNEKPTNFQFIMPKDDRFQCDNLKGTTAAGSETVVTFTYKPQPLDPMLAKIPVLMGVGQWKQIKVELKMSGGFIKAGGTDAISLDVVLKVYVNQI